MLWGKSSRCVMVTKGWFRVSMGVILLSASMVSIFFSRSMNSRRSAFSTNMSLPSSSVVMFTWKQAGQVTKGPSEPRLPHFSLLCPSSRSPAPFPAHGGYLCPVEGTHRLLSPPRRWLCSLQEEGRLWEGARGRWHLQTHLSDRMETAPALIS